MEKQIVLEIPKKLLTANQIRWYGNFIKSGVIEIDSKLNSCQTHPMQNSRGLQKEPSPGGKCIAILRSPIMLLWAGVQYSTLHFGRNLPDYIFVPQRYQRLWDEIYPMKKTAG